MPLSAYQGTAQDAQGNVLAWPFQVRVMREGTPPTIVPLYSDRAGTTPVANPLVVDGSEGWEAGFFRFFAGPGAYRVLVSKGAEAAEELRYVALGRASETDLTFAVPRGEWDDEATYDLGDMVSIIDGTDAWLFISVQDDNLNHAPDDTTPGDTAWWMYAGQAAPGPKGDPGEVESSNDTVFDIIKLTQSEYDALSPPVATTLYVITD